MFELSFIGLQKLPGGPGILGSHGLPVAGSIFDDIIFFKSSAITFPRSSIDLGMFPDDDIGVDGDWFITQLRPSAFFTVTPSGQQPYMLFVHVFGKDGG
jgi:hypothetical protein